jgi:chromosome segregation ATPase
MTGPAVGTPGSNIIFTNDDSAAYAWMDSSKKWQRHAKGLEREKAALKDYANSLELKIEKMEKEAGEVLDGLGFQRNERTKLQKKVDSLTSHSAALYKEYEKAYIEKNAWENFFTHVYKEFSSSLTDEVANTLLEKFEAEARENFRKRKAEDLKS